MASGFNVPLTFQIYKVDSTGESLIRTETLTQDIIKVGKLSSSHLRIDDEAVSRMHAVIEITGPSEIQIIDLGSTKGTLVNGQKVNKSKIQSGDAILLGNTKVVVTVGEPTVASVELDDGPTAVQNTSKPMPPVRSTVMGMAAPVITPSMAPSPVFPPPPTASMAYPPPPVGPQSMVPPSLSGAVPPPPGFPMHSAAAAVAAAPSPMAYMGPPPGFDPTAVELQDGSRAIEVAAMFEDSVVELRHFTNPEGGQVTGKTKGILTAAATALFIALVVFIVNYVQITRIAAAREAWEKSGKPVNEFIVPREGPAMDIIASLCLAFGVLGVFVGLSRILEERHPRDFTIGPDRDTVFNAPGELLPVGSFPLVRSTGSDYELVFTQQMAGDVTLAEGGGQSIPLPQLVQSGRAHVSRAVPGAYAFAIPIGARAKIDLGANTFLVSSVPSPRRYPAPIQINWSEQMYTGITAGAVALFLLMIFSMPPDQNSLSLDAFMNDQRFAKFLIKPPEEKAEQIPDWLKKKSDDAGGKGKRHKGDEGKMGKKESKNKAGLYALKGPKDNPDPHLAKMLATEAAQKAGVLGVMKSMEGSHMASIFGRDSALGTDAADVMGSLVGTQIGEANGAGGLGLVGSGRGGGGTGEGTIGLGSLGTIGKGGGGGTGSGYGRGAGGLGGRRAHAPDVVPGTAQVRGSLDKEIIRRIIRRHLNEVRFCYEKELMKKQDLFGRVMIQFTISGTGAVVASMVQNSTMNNPPVEQCIAQSVRRWEFPKPQGGGIVIVSYPFVLKAAGAE
jgi:pSer/pThr/pTyr-binding forkhead associated (FHA) protein